MKKRIKVGFITDDIDRKAMGTAMYMQRLIEEFSKNFKDDIELVLIHREGKCTVPECGLARNIAIPTFKLPKFSGVFSFMRFFFTCKEEFDIIHFPRPKLYPFFWCLKAKKFVVTFHDAPEKGSPRFRTPANYFWEWSIKLWFHRYIDASFGASIYSAQTIFRYYRTDPAKTFGVQNGREDGFFPVTNAQKEAFKMMLAAKYKIPFPYILQATRFVPHKNPHRIIRAFGVLKKKYVSPHYLVIMGGGSSHDPKFDVVVRRAIEESGVKEHIFKAPYIATEDLNALYNCADAFIQAGTSDGFSIPIANALAAGVPIVTSNLSCFPENVGEAGLLANPFDPEDMAEKLHMAVSDQDLRKILTTRGLEYGKRYNWQRTAAEILRIYKKTLQR